MIETFTDCAQEILHLQGFEANCDRYVDFKSSPHVIIGEDTDWEDMATWELDGR